MPLNLPQPRRRGAAGFTLAELLVTLLIVSVGMLGLVKMEAAAVSESQVSRVRSLMTFQAESPAGVMRANPGYWAATTSPFPSFSLAADGTPSPTAVGTPSDCTTVVCTPTQMAYFDLNQWTAGYTAAFPGALASISCAGVGGAACAAGGAVPTSYDIKLTWSEKWVAINRSSAGSTTPVPVSIVLHVQP